MRISLISIPALAILLMTSPIGWAQEGEAPVASPAQPEAVDGQPAQPADQPAGDQPPADGQQEQPGQRGRGQDGFLQSGWFLVVLVGLFVLMWVFSSRSRKKQAKARQEMLASLSKGDKVTTIGGLVGTVMDVRDDEVTVKVDEGNNVKVRVARWAVRGIGEEAKTQGPEERR